MQDESWQTIAIGDAEIEFTDQGSGEAVFLVHAGVFSDWFRFVGQSEEFDGYRVIRPRRVGYGRFQPDRHVTLADHGQHAASLAAHLGIDAIHWVGHSSSCLIGLSLAMQQPQFVRSLTLLEPAAGANGFDVPASYDRPDFVGAAMAAFSAGDLAAAFDHFMKGVCGEGYREILEQRLGKSGLENAIRESAFFFQDEVQAVMEARFDPTDTARIKQPVLCLEGGAQPTPTIAQMSRQISERTVELLPQTQVVVIPSVNHALPLQDPEAVAHSIGSFLRQVTELCE